MNKIPIEVLRAFSEVRELTCRCVLISAYGAMQIGLGGCVTYLLGGKHPKERCEVELGTFGEVWSYHSSNGMRLNGHEVERDLIGQKIETVQMTDAGLLIIATSGAELQVARRTSSDDIFYVHFSTLGMSAFLDSNLSWSIEMEGES